MRNIDTDFRVRHQDLKLGYRRINYELVHGVIVRNSSDYYFISQTHEAYADTFGQSGWSYKISLDFDEVSFDEFRTSLPDFIPDDQVADILEFLIMRMRDYKTYLAEMRSGDFSNMQV
tara:strand:+ start:406 stop:759 length:354 start_codon:yes stop_codon:yes gene_type:complete